MSKVYDLHLPESEKKEKEQLIKVVKDGLNKFIEVGLALAALRDKKLYRDTHKTFEEFVSDTFSIGIRYAQMLMKGVKTVENLKIRTQVRLPESERQVRPLSEFDDTPDTQAKLWEKAVEKAGGESPSPATVRDVVEKYYEEECGCLPQEEYYTEDELQKRKSLGEEIGKPTKQWIPDSANLQDLKEYWFRLKSAWGRASKTDKRKFCQCVGVKENEFKNFIEKHPHIATSTTVKAVARQQVN